MAKDNARKTAVDILTAVLRDKAYSNITVNKFFSESNLSMQDKALASALVYGVLDRKITIDHIIKQYVKSGLSKIKPITLNAVRIALYQIIYMDKIPESAAVNESVNIVKFSKEKYNASFVNGVLRAYLREPYKIKDGKSVKDLSVKYSCTEWIVESFIKDYGADTAEKLLEESLKKPPVVLRVNNLKTNAEKLIDILSRENVWALKTEYKNALILSSAIDISNSPSYKNGLFHVEDLASQRVIDKLALNENSRVLDICSAPGGKAFTMAEIMNNTGEIVATDLYDHRVKLIADGAKRLSVKNIKTYVSDATCFDKNLGKFDVVLCDVPCSGLGVIRRKPEIKYKDVSKNELKELEETQAKILETASLYVKDGGLLCYSTCTLRADENKSQISAFLDKHGCFDVKYSDEYMPHTDGTDGFFCAVLTKSR